MDTFGHVFYIQRDKKLYYVEDVNNYIKEKEIKVLTNRGSPLFYRKGRLTFLPLSVHVNENYLAKITSLKDVNNIAGVHVTIDTLIEKYMNVILSYGTVFKLKECGLGLYYYDMTSTDEQNSAKTNATINLYYLLSTANENKEFYTRADIEGSDRARIYQGILV